MSRNVFSMPLGPEDRCYSRELQVESSYEGGDMFLQFQIIEYGKSREMKICAPVKLPVRTIVEFLPRLNRLVDHIDLCVK